MTLGDALLEGILRIVYSKLKYKRMVSFLFGVFRVLLMLFFIVTFLFCSKTS